MFRGISAFAFVSMATLAFSAPEKAGKSVAEIAADHTLSGTQAQPSRVLDDKEAPYSVTSDYFVDTGTELVVKEGVTLIFAKNAGLSIQGSLKMEGSSEAPVVCKGKTTGIGVWGGIKVCSKSNVDIEWVSITGAKCGVKLEENAAIRKAFICKNEQGIECRAGGSTLEDCYISDNRSDGLSVHGTLKTVDHCTISGNGGNGICGWGGVLMKDSVLFRNKVAGINCWNGGCEVTINGSYIAENKKYDIQNGCGTTWDCTENFWGVSVTKTLDAKGDSVNLPKILDRKDDASKGVVNVSKWLKEKPADCGAREFPGKKPSK